MKSLKQTLIERDNLTPAQADQAIQDAKEQLNEYLNFGDLEAAYDICESEFGLEPDFIMDLM